jgi:hypothetical protein
LQRRSASTRTIVQGTQTNDRGATRRDSTESRQGQGTRFGASEYDAPSTPGAFASRRSAGLAKGGHRIPRRRQESGRPNRSITRCEPTGRGGERCVSAVGRLELVGSSWGRDSFATETIARRSFSTFSPERLCGHPRRKDRRATSYDNLATAGEKGPLALRQVPFLLLAGPSVASALTPGIPLRATSPGFHPDPRVRACR